jgi:hypothetical protein
LTATNIIVEVKVTIKAGQTKETLTLHQKSMRSILRLKEVFYKYKLEFRIFKQYFFKNFKAQNEDMNNQIIKNLMVM